MRQRQDYERDYEDQNGVVYADVTTFWDNLDTEVRVTLKPRFTGDADFYGEGFALCSTNDHYDKQLGQQIAYCRALVDAAGNGVGATGNQVGVTPITP
jgi:hypothetical protein